MSKEESTARAEMNRWEINGIQHTGWQSKAADRDSKNNWQLATGREASQWNQSAKSLPDREWLEVSSTGIKVKSTATEKCFCAKDKQQSIRLLQRASKFSIPLLAGRGNLHLNRFSWLRIIQTYSSHRLCRQCQSNLLQRQCFFFLLCCPMMPEVDVGGRSVEVELSC